MLGLWHYQSSLGFISWCTNPFTGHLFVKVMLNWRISASGPVKGLALIKCWTAVTANLHSFVWFLSPLCGSTSSSNIYTYLLTHNRLLFIQKASFTQCYSLIITSIPVKMKLASSAICLWVMLDRQSLQWLLAFWIFYIHLSVVFFT